MFLRIIEINNKTNFISDVFIVTHFPSLKNTLD
jgi:hypothetical protein